MKESILSIKIKEYRADQSLTQQELAEMLDVSDKSISKWELGKTYPSKKNIIKIAELLNLPIELLLLEEVVEDRQKGNQISKFIVPILIVGVLILTIFNFISLQTIKNQGTQMNTQKKQIEQQQTELNKEYSYSAFLVLAPNTAYSDFKEYIEQNFDVDNVYVNDKSEHTVITFDIKAHNNEEMSFLFNEIKQEAPGLTNADFHMIL